MRTGVRRYIATACVAGAVGLGVRPALAQAVVGPTPPDGQVAAVGTGRLDGLVTDHRGVPLARVAVTAEGADLQLAVSDERGRFSFQGLPPGPYLVRAMYPGYVSSKRELVHVRPARASWQEFRLTRVAAVPDVLEGQPVLGAGLMPLRDPATADTEDHDHSALAWRLRHLRRSVLRDEGHGVTSPADRTAIEAWLVDAGSPLARPMAAVAATPGPGSGWLPQLPVSGQVQLLTSSQFDSPADLFSAQAVPGGIAFLALGAPVGESAHWTAQVAFARGDISTWTVSGQYRTALTDDHQVDVVVAYGLQRYDGPNPLLLAAVAQGNRDGGAVTITDRWQLARHATLTVGTSYARYGYVDGPPMWSPAASLRWQPAQDVWIRALVSQRMTAPGAEEFTTATVGASWVPSQRLFSTAVAGAPFRPSRTRHLEVAVDREIGGLVLSARAFRQDVEDQIVTMFGPASTGGVRADDLGYYYTANGGDFDATGCGVSVSRPVGSRLRGELAYSLSRARWAPSTDARALAATTAVALRPAAERLHDLAATVETDVRETATRVVAVYRFSVGVPEPPHGSAATGPMGRFDVQVNQRLPFLDFTAAEWEVLVAVRNLFRERVDGMSVYDEWLVIRPPKRLVGGLLVRF